MVCGLCGELLQRAARVAGAPARMGRAGVHAPNPVEQPWGGAEPEPAAPGPLGLPEPIFFLGLGALLAPVLTWTPLLQYIGWFLASLVHEMGHSVVAWAFGMPAYPAIRIDGHAASVHQDQVLLLVLAAWAGLGATAWWLRRHRVVLVALGIATVLYPLFAFTRLKEVLHLAGGHLGELAFATICFWRALHPGFTEKVAERALYAMLGWYLCARNVVLCGGLLRNAATREWYEQSGSFGLTNDYLRLAHDVLGTGLSTVAGVMLLTSLVPLPLALLVWGRTHE
jgi:hypothetical protein